MAFLYLIEEISAVSFNAHQPEFPKNLQDRKPQVSDVPKTVPDTSNGVTTIPMDPPPYSNPPSRTANSPPSFHSSTSALHNTSYLYPSVGLEKRMLDYDITPAEQYARRRARRTRLLVIICCVVLLLITLTIGLAVAGVALRWGNSGYCVRWDDGSTSGDCKPKRWVEPKSI